MTEVLPVFIKIDDYNKVLEAINDVKEKIRSAQVLLDEVKQIKNQEDKQIEVWEKNISQIEEKANFISKSFSNPERRE